MEENSSRPSYLGIWRQREGIEGATLAIHYSSQEKIHSNIL
jgi:hypothetical protein